MNSHEESVRLELIEAQRCEIERLREALQRIADVNVDDDLQHRVDVMSGIAWATLYSRGRA